MHCIALFIFAINSKVKEADYTRYELNLRKRKMTVFSFEIERKRHFRAVNLIGKWCCI